MSAMMVSKDEKKEESFFKRPMGVLLDEKHWLYLKNYYNMTPRELQVAILICRGFNSNEVAKALKMKHGTVKTHLRNIYRRTRVKSKILLLLRFIEDVGKSSAFSQAAPSLGDKTENQIKITTAEISGRK